MDRSGAPLSRSRPCVGVVRVARMSTSVDLPAPLDPTTCLHREVEGVQERDDVADDVEGGV